jgi:two-component system NtrC family sensor kinase
MQARRTTIRLVQVAMVASLLIPCMVFAYASWISYAQIKALADERIERSLDVQQEQATKAFQLVDLVLNDVQDEIAELSYSGISRNEERLHYFFKKLVTSVPEVQSVWIYDKDGRALVTSTVHPPPDTQRYSERDFFQAHVKDDVGTYFGEIYNSQFNGQPFFAVSRRLTRDGEFAGVLQASVLPSSFFRFYSKLAYTTGLQYALLREDGVFLVRFPVPAGPLGRLDERTGFRRKIAQDPSGGSYTTTSPVDNIERRFGVRRLGIGPLYISTGIATSTIQDEWMKGMAFHLIFGIPATLLLFTTLAIILRRTERLHGEIDRRQIAEDSLRQSQKLEAIGHLTGGVAHDFNNLLTIIIGNLDLTQRQLNSWTEGAQFKLQHRIDAAMQGARRAAALTKRLLAFSRQQPLNPTSIDVNRLFVGLADFFRRTLSEDISLEIVGAAGVWPIEADLNELEAALLNLAVNARDAMPSGGKLTIEASNSYLDANYCRDHELQPGQYVQISVTDTGSGMTPDVIDRAFEPFFTTKTSGHGTGLGLSQVYGFVKQSGGHVKLYSEVGEGTTVKIYLRRFIGESPQEEVSKTEIKTGHPNECILVVEDDADVRAYVVETLQGLKYHVLEASNGEGALALLDRHAGRIALLLSDVVMPGMNGRKLADEAKRRQPALKVLYMTGYSRNAIVHQGRLDPGVDLIQKPLTSELLAAMVRKVLDA